MKKCGECSACCVPFAVPEVGKTDGMKLCHHATSGGCAIYASRPKACRLFQCLWISRPDMADSWRPDKLGVMILISTFDAEGQSVQVVNIWEVRPGASKIKIVRELARLNRVQRGMGVSFHTLNSDGTTNHSLISLPDGLSKAARTSVIAQFKKFVGDE